jgi:Putative  PD-(D/E)XK family member, (DUF4420)
MSLPVDNISTKMTAFAAELKAQQRDLGAYAIARIPWAPTTRLGHGTEGFALLLPAGPEAEPDLVLKNIRVRFNLLCRVQEQGKRPFDETVTIVECTSTDPWHQETFVRVSGLLLASDAQAPGEIQSLVGALVELFRSFESAPVTSAIGLWSELFVLVRSADVALAASAWHGLPNDRYDFAHGDARIDVKAASGTREHHFSLDQLRPPAGTRGFIVSVITVPSAAGPTIQTLVDKILASVPTDLRDKVLRNVLAVAGRSWPDMARASFDDALALETTRWFDCADIPSVPDPPFEVSAVRFISNLSDVTPLLSDHLKTSGELMAALLVT